jgi:uncharacterized protein YggE
MWRSAVIVLALAGAALAAGCGGDDEGDPEAVAAGGPARGALAADVSSQPPAAGAAPGAAGITVVGTGSVSVVPDTAEWSFGVQTVGDTADAALRENSAAVERLLAALRDAGVDGKDLRTEQVSVYPRTSSDGLTVTGYDASNTVRATVRGLERAGAVVDAASEAGANQIYGPSLTVSDAAAQYREAVDAAYDDARSRAEAIAAKAGLSLGAPVAIVEGGGGVGPLPFAAREDAAAAGADVPIEPGVQEIGATLTVTFAIG